MARIYVRQEGKQRLVNVLGMRACTHCKLLPLFHRSADVSVTRCLSVIGIVLEFLKGE